MLFHALRPNAPNSAEPSHADWQFERATPPRHRDMVHSAWSSLNGVIQCDGYDLWDWGMPICNLSPHGFDPSKYYSPPAKVVHLNSGTRYSPCAPAHAAPFSSFDGLLSSTAPRDPEIRCSGGIGASSVVLCYTELTNPARRMLCASVIAFKWNSSVQEGLAPRE